MDFRELLLKLSTKEDFLIGKSKWKTWSNGKASKGKESFFKGSIVDVSVSLPLPLLLRGVPNVLLLLGVVIVLLLLGVVIVLLLERSIMFGLSLSFSSSAPSFVKLLSSDIFAKVWGDCGSWTLILPFTDWLDNLGFKDWFDNLGSFSFSFLVASSEIMERAFKLGYNIFVYEWRFLCIFASEFIRRYRRYKRIITIIFFSTDTENKNIFFLVFFFFLLYGNVFCSVFSFLFLFQIRANKKLLFFEL